MQYFLSEISRGKKRDETLRTVFCEPSARFQTSLGTGKALDRRMLSDNNHNCGLYNAFHVTGQCRVPHVHHLFNVYMIQCRCYYDLEFWRNEITLWKLQHHYSSKPPDEMQPRCVDAYFSATCDWVLWVSGFLGPWFSWDQFSLYSLIQLWAAVGSDPNPGPSRNLEPLQSLP